ncbi:MAG: CYTH domain-containing protein [Crocinitomicaceae bacterium]|jgi:adenylate cyclase|nr:CYTH domain-containing protein [Crocinitomicaceae bacterium]MDG1658099.1 CYTH domain-containing protein [Crocinitomicaceae bacterium]|tara:strand:- start:5396 stop:5845 length:450 start_codon:yes stop_codon:yes gene_type:complete
MKEIEYKFLVDHKKWEDLPKPSPELIVQGYLSSSIDCTVRVRIKGSNGYLTIKGKTEGVTRTEFEYEIPVNDAEEMIDLFTDKHIRKERFEILHCGRTWEVDVFQGNHEGLILAELEVESEGVKFDLPDWTTKDVSTDPNYYNAVLIEK